MKKNILFIIIVFHLLSTLAIGGYVHAFHDSPGGYACPIPLAMGAGCAESSDQQPEVSHFFTSTGYLVSILAVPLAAGVIFFLFAFARSGKRESNDIGASLSLRMPLLRFSFLRGNLLRRLCRWLVLHRGDDDVNPVRVFVFIILSLCHHINIKNSHRSSAILYRASA